MEQIHGVDVSWMTHGNPKDKASRTAGAARPSALSEKIGASPTSSVTSSPPSPNTTAAGNETGHTLAQNTAPAVPRQIPARPALARTVSDEKKAGGLVASSPSRKGSWFANISSKFSSGNGAAAQSPPQASNASPRPAEMSVPKANPAKNAVLQHAVRHEGEGPYTPAPPRSSAPAGGGILQVFRRLSSSSGNLSPVAKFNHNHGLVERRVLNVDPQRERCAISGLNPAKLRRVAFCVDVEIAPMPRYAAEVDGGADKKACEKVGAESRAEKAEKAEKTQKQKMTEKDEGEALKRARPVECERDEAEGEVKPAEEQPATAQAQAQAQAQALPAKELTKDCESAPRDTPQTEKKEEPTSNAPAADKASDSKKKDKKKKSEEERKARKEKKRKLAEANGTIPMEIYLDSDSSSTKMPTPRIQAIPTTNPVRIYRRCCQLRESPILKRITEQLGNQANYSAQSGLVEKLDLTGYWMQLADLVTLGDYLAVVPVKEVILENCRLTDEGLRVILAGLLAAKRPEAGKLRKPLSGTDGLAQQGGAVERLVLKNNKIGPEGWKHICLFIYLCRTLKSLDLSNIAFPQPGTATPPTAGKHHGQAKDASPSPLDLAALLSKSLGERLGGSTLSLLGLGGTGLSTVQLGAVIDGVIRCGVQRLGLAHNNIDVEGMRHVTRFLRDGACEGLDLGGNNLRDQLGVVADALTEDHPLWALSLAECNLVPSSLCKLFPRLVTLKSFKFIDLSHNHELFTTNPSAVSVLRRYLPKMPRLKRIHLSDCALSSAQVIALAEILPEIRDLAHISLMENPALVALMNADTEETHEEACALFAALLAAVRVSSSLLAIDIEVPGDHSCELVKAMAKQVVAYCLRNMERLPVPEFAAAAAAAGMPTAAQAEAMKQQVEQPEYPVVLQHLVGRNNRPAAGERGEKGADGGDGEGEEDDEDEELAPDEDYVIGGTGVVKALECCLDNRGDESRRQSGEFLREVETGVPQPSAGLPSGKAKDMSKHLLASARKIRHRLQPAIQKARAACSQDSQGYQRLLFLDNTLGGIIKRFEDEFPDTRESESGDSAVVLSTDANVDNKLGTSLSSGDGDPYAPTPPGSDGEEEVEGEVEGEGEVEVEGEMGGTAKTTSSPLLTPSRSNSIISLTSKALTHEEGRVFRAGHTFRRGIIRPEHYQLLLSGIEMVAANPAHVRLLHDMLDELQDERYAAEAAVRGVVPVFQEHRDDIIARIRDADPEYWRVFVHSQNMARANVNVDMNGGAAAAAAAAATGGKPSPLVQEKNDEAIIVEESEAEAEERGLQMSRARTEEATERVE